MRYHISRAMMSGILRQLDSPVRTVRWQAVLLNQASKKIIQTD